MSYQDKYLKYKNKYLLIKKHILINNKLNNYIVFILYNLTIQLNIFNNINNFAT